MPHKELFITLNELGIRDLTDFSTIIPKDSFEKLSPVTVAGLRRSYGIMMPILSAESRFQLVNRILELKHGLIIEPIKQLDNIPDGGYRLQKLSGFGI